MRAVAVRRGWGWPVLAALTLSTIGDEISLLVLMLRAADGNGAFAVPALLVAQLLPGLLAAPYAGRLVDTRDAGRLLVLCSLVEAAVIAWMALHPDPVATVAGAAALGISFAISGAAAFALIPVLATALGMPLARANALLEFVRGTGMLAGPVAGGMLVAAAGATGALLVDAASFAVLAAVVLASGLRRPAAPEPGTAERTLLADYLPLLRDRRVTVMIGALTLEVYATAIADVAFVFLVTVTMRAGAAAFGVLTACWAAGMLAGAGWGAAMAMRRPAPLAFAAAATMGGTMLAIGVGWPLGAALVGGAFVVGGAANSIHNVAVRTMLLRESPAAMHGRVAAMYGAATSSAAMLGYLTGGLFAPARAPDAYWLAGLLGIAAGAVGWLLFARVRR